MKTLEVKPGKSYRIKGNSKYFAGKYGTPNPIIRIEDTDHKVLGQSWMNMNSNPAAMLFGMRAGMEDLDMSGRVFYGKIGALGELVTETELEKISGGVLEEQLAALDKEAGNE